MERIRKSDCSEHRLCLGTIMRYTTLFIICGIMALLGSLFLALQKEWILIRMPQANNAPSSLGIAKIKKPITIHFWHDARWHTEKQDILWSSNDADNLYSLVTCWLNTLDAEEITAKKVILQDATLSPSSTDAYLSFDRNPFQQKWSTYEKWMWIEGLLKTIREQGLPIKNIYFLVHHRPLVDRHIDTSHSWRVEGFLYIK